MIEPHYDGTASIDPFYTYNLTKTYIEKLKGIEIASRRSYFNRYVPTLHTVLSSPELWLDFSHRS